MTLCFDHNAGTPVDARVLARFLEVERSCPGNAGSPHAAGRAAREALEEARGEAAQALGLASDEVLFVSGGTEANNMIVAGLGDPRLPVLLSPLEHPSVLEPAERRGRLLLDVDRDGRAILARPSAPVGLVTLVHAQNELGTLQDLRAAADLAGALGVPFHVDAAQTLGRVALDLPLALADAITFSLHKAGGLRGQSVLVVRAGAKARLVPLMAGGRQERSLRPGTESVGLAAATALALRLAIAEQDARAARMAAAKDAFLAAVGDAAARDLSRAPALPNTAMLLFEVPDGRVLLPALDLAGVQASQGSACSSGSPLPPRALTAIQLSDADARRCVRFSFAHTTTIDDARRGGEIVRRVIALAKHAAAH